MVKLRIYRIKTVWSKYSIPYPCMSRSMIHSVSQFAQCWTSFNLNWIKSQLNITKIVLLIGLPMMRWSSVPMNFFEVWPDSLNSSGLENPSIIGKSLGRIPPPKIIISCHSPIQKGTLSAIKLQFHMADMPREEKQKLCQKLSNFLPLVFHVMDCWTLPCMPPYTFAVKLWWRRFSGVG